MTLLFFEKKSRQKKLQLSGSLCGFLIICTDGAFAKRQKKLWLSGTIYRFLIKPSPVGEGGSRRLTDEVYFCKRNFGYREVCASPVEGICECAKHACRRRRDGFGNRGAVRFSSIFSPLFYLKKIPAGAGIFIAFILPNKRQIRRQSERQRRLQSPMRRYRRARGECLSGRQPRRTCPSAYVREFSRFSESASRRRS